MNIGYIFSGSLVVELVFSLNGMGTVIYNAAGNRDYVVMQGAFFIVVCHCYFSKFFSGYSIDAGGSQNQKGNI